MGWVGNSGISEATMVTEGRIQASGDQPRSELLVSNQDSALFPSGGKCISIKKAPPLKLHLWAPRKGQACSRHV